MKGAQRTAIGGGAFREHQQRMLLFQVAGHLFADQLTVARPTTDKQAASLGRQPTRHRPGAHFGLGQKRHWREHAQQRDVGPGHVIADPQHRLLGQLTLNGDLEGQGIAQPRHEKPRPALASDHRVGDARALEQPEQAGHAQTECDHHQYSRNPRVHAQAAHHMAALKCLA